MFTVITLTKSKSLVALSATALLLAGCGGSSGSGDAASTSAAAPAMTGVPQMSDQQAPPERLLVDVTIKGGKVTPTDEQLQAKVGNPIVVRIDSDVVDQLHVKSNPEHLFTVQPQANQSFQFTVTVPGTFDVELKQLNRTIATITVQ